jgi:hypothetical protein
MKGYGGSGSTAPRILNVDTGWRCVVRFIPAGRAPGTHFLGGRVARRVGPEAVDERRPFVLVVTQTSIPCRLWFMFRTSLSLFVMYFPRKKCISSAHYIRISYLFFFLNWGLSLNP